MSNFGSAAGIVAGQAFVEVGADTSKMQQQIIDGVTKALNSSSGGIGTNLSVLRQLSEARWIDRLAQGLNQASAEAVKLKTAFDEGKISAGEMTDKLVGAIPYIGQFWQLGRNINELFTGDNEELQRSVEYVQTLNDLMQGTMEIMKQGPKTIQDLDKGFQSVIDDLNKIGQLGILRPEDEAKTALDKALAEAKQKAADAKQKFIDDHMIDVITNNTTGQLRLAGHGGAIDPLFEMASKMTADQVRRVLTSQLSRLQVSGEDIITKQLPGGFGTAQITETGKRKNIEDGFAEQVSDLQAQVGALGMRRRAIDDNSKAIDKDVAAKTADANQAYGLSQLRLARNTLNNAWSKANEFWDKFVKKGEETYNKIAHQEDTAAAEAARKRAEQLKETGAARFDLARSLETPAERLKEVTKELDQLLAHHVIVGQEYQRALTAINGMGENGFSRGVMGGWDLDSLKQPAIDSGSKDVGERIAGQIDRLIGMLGQGMQFN